MQNTPSNEVTERTAPAASSTRMTPLMQQYWDVKAHHEDKVVLFRMGDFFEMFHQDAETAAPVLGIALTQRNKKDADSAKMCGVPHHSIAGPIAKLLAAGHKVALCDQVEDPATAKGLVKREVTRVLTPGMVYDPDTLDQLSANYLCSYSDGQMAFADITTGEAFLYAYHDTKEREELLALLSPVEIVLDEKEFKKRKHDLLDKALLSQFNPPRGTGLDETPEPSAVINLRAYIAQMQGAETLKSLPQFERRDRHKTMRLSLATIRHLEIFTNSRGESTGSLFEAIQRTKTSAGARMLRSWLTSPLLDIVQIHERQNAISMWREDSQRLERFRQTLAKLGDVERRVGKIHSVTFNARDLVAIARSIQAGLALHQIHPSPPVHLSLQPCSALAQKIETTFNEELPHSVKEGGLIRKGVVAELDDLMALTQDAQSLLLELEAREKTATGITSLKIRYNNVFGFYIELTKTHAHKAPSHYMRKQTLTNAERFTTEELNKLEEKILSARSKRDQLEFEIFQDLRRQVLEMSRDILLLSRLWTNWDVLTSLAWLSIERKYCRPELTVSGDLHLELCRHPVVETTVRDGFTPNTVTLKSGEAMLLTGPNMAGKSTLMRQVALSAILAQMGSFVPADRAVLPIFNQVFTRIGASDFLSEGLSTFMVEMTETSEILKRVDSRSLVVMDEIGRGTSTYDGLSLAQAILEYLVSQKNPYLLFATHYHELTGLAHRFASIKNAHMSVEEKSGQIRFLHTLVSGPANRSYGIHVAKLAGLPGSVTKRAQQILGGFENFGGSGGQLTLQSIPVNDLIASTGIEDLTEQPEALPAFLKEFAELDLSGMTPLEALNKLYAWQRELSS
jgi:DNA mismatch repair protein MutS